MLVRELINRLKNHEHDLILRARVGSFKNKFLYVDLLGCDYNIPGVYLCEEPPLPFFKYCGSYLAELQLLASRDGGLLNNSTIYLVMHFNHDDGSYDFRYFEIEDIIPDTDSLVLVGSTDDCQYMRQTYEAFDESNYDLDE